MGFEVNKTSLWKQYSLSPCVNTSQGVIAHSTQDTDCYSTIHHALSLWYILHSHTLCLTGDKFFLHFTHLDNYFQQVKYI